MGEQMRKAPVYFTVAQIRFNPILDMEGYLPSIQEKMRVSGFPDFKRLMSQQLVLAPGKDAESPLSPSLVSQTQCLFGDIGNTSGIVLTPSSVAYQTADYKVFKSFLGVFQTGLGIINDILQLQYTERIGLRYLDAVFPGAGESLSSYLRPEVLGLSEVVNGAPFRHSFSETVADITEGRIVSRVIIQDGKLGLPQEIAALAPAINKRFLSQECRHAILDTDAFSESREAFNAESAGKKLILLHDEINTAFRSIVTKHALQMWE